MILEGLEARPVTLSGSELGAGHLYLGEGDATVEVITVDLKSKPKGALLREAWAKRWGGRAAPVMLVALYEEKAALCAPVGSEPYIEIDVEPGEVDRLCRAALSQPDRHAACGSRR